MWLKFQEWRRRKTKFYNNPTRKADLRGRNVQRENNCCTINMRSLVTGLNWLLRSAASNKANCWWRPWQKCSCWTNAEGHCGSRRTTRDDPNCYRHSTEERPTDRSHRNVRVELHLEKISQDETRWKPSWTRVKGLRDFSVTRDVNPSDNDEIPFRSNKIRSFQQGMRRDEKSNCLTGSVGSDSRSRIFDD